MVISNWYKSNLNLAAKAIMTLMEVNRATGAKVSLYSIPGFWAKPLTTKLAFLRSTSPFSLYLVFKTHFYPIGDLFAGHFTNSQTSFLIKPSYSIFMASFHFSAWGPDNNSSTDSVKLSLTSAPFLDLLELFCKFSFVCLHFLFVLCLAFLAPS